MNKIYLNTRVYNGLIYENNTNIKNFLNPNKIEYFGPGKNDNFEEYIINFQVFYRLEKTGLKNYLYEHSNHYYERNLQPDEVFINTEKNIIYILEKKFQKCSGSADEKIQTGPFKLEYYQKLYPTYKIKFAYVLSNWFKSNKYKFERQFLKKHKIDILWGENKYYFQNLLLFLK